MILIADSGSTKTDWCLEHDGMVLRRVVTQGINPFHQDEVTIEAIISDELLPQMGDDNVDRIVFYGSGCRGNRIAAMRRLLGQAFPQVRQMEILGDLLAAARAVCGTNEGIACILGTGANSCLYDGRTVVENTPPLGYILGDEGSGAVLGRNFVNAVFKGRMPVAVRDGFMAESGLTMDEIINRVYREPMANRFLAGISGYIHSCMDVPEVRAMVVDSFRKFFEYNVKPYGRTDLRIGAIGSIAYCYSAELAEAAAAEGFVLGNVMRSPMDGLVRFHG